MVTAPLARPASVPARSRYQTFDLRYVCFIIFFLVLLYAFKTTVRGSDLTWTLAARIGRDADENLWEKVYASIGAVNE